MATTPTSGPALVVGAGPTGLAMAAGLWRHGVPCRVVDKAAAPSDNSRAVAIQARTLELFDLMGTVAPVLEHGVEAHGASFYGNGRRLVHIVFHELDSPYPYTIDLNQAETESILRGHLASLGGSVEWGRELATLRQDAEGVDVTLRDPDGATEQARFRWVVGCDGAHSTVRHALGVEFGGEAFPTTFAVAELTLDCALPQDEWNLFMHEEGLLAAFPLGKDRWRIIAEAPALEGEPPREPTVADFQHWLDQRATVPAKITDAKWPTRFRVSERRAQHSRVGRVFLAGDAVHIHSPAGGQGMNTGLQDAINLGWKLGLVENGGAPLALLDSYEAERMPVAAALIRITTAMGRMALVRNPITDAVRMRLLPLLAAQEVFQQRALQWVSELEINYRKSPIVAEQAGRHFGRGRFLAGPHAGDRAPDAQPLQRPDGGNVRLFDMLRHPGHTLLLFQGPDADGATRGRVATVAGGVVKRLGQRVRVVEVAAAGALAAPDRGNPQRVYDPEGMLHHRYGAEQESLYLIRPDGYVAYRGGPLDLAALTDYLDRVFT